MLQSRKSDCGTGPVAEEDSLNPARICRWLQCSLSGVEAVVCLNLCLVMSRQSLPGFLGSVRWKSVMCAIMLCRDGFVTRGREGERTVQMCPLCQSKSRFAYIIIFLEQFSCFRKDLKKWNFLQILPNW